MKERRLKVDRGHLEKLTPQQVNICVLGGTEKAFSGKYDKHFEPGTYLCTVCTTPLFSSISKFDSGSGWPSFDAPIEKGTVGYKEDYSTGTLRWEVQCASCGAHLGHVFKDRQIKGEEKLGYRFCINSLALDFKPAKTKSKTKSPR